MALKMVALGELKPDDMPTQPAIVLVGTDEELRAVGKLFLQPVAIVAADDS